MKTQKLIELPILRGEDSPNCKLDKQKVHAIKIALQENQSIKLVAARAGVSTQTVYLIGVGKIWTDVEPVGRITRKRAFITKRTRDRIFQWKRKHDATNIATADHFGVSTSAVSRAVKDAYAVLALKVHRAVLSAGTYEQVAKHFGIKRSEIEDMLAFVTDGKIPQRLKDES